MNTCTLLQIYLSLPSSHPHIHGHEDALMIAYQKTSDPVPYNKQHNCTVYWVWSGMLNARMQNVLNARNAKQAYP